MKVMVIPQTILLPSQHRHWISNIDLHDDWNKNRRTKALQQDIRERLEHGVRDEENRERGIIFARRQGMLRWTKTLLQTVNLRVADVCSVEECQKVEDTELHS
jgi:hypothetical protein